MTQVTGREGVTPREVAVLMVLRSPTLSVTICADTVVRAWSVDGGRCVLEGPDADVGVRSRDAGSAEQEAGA